MPLLQSIVICIDTDNVENESNDSDANNEQQKVVVGTCGEKVGSSTESNTSECRTNYESTGFPFHNESSLPNGVVIEHIALAMVYRLIILQIKEKSKLYKTQMVEGAENTSVFLQIVHK